MAADDIIFQLIPLGAVQLLEQYADTRDAADHLSLWIPTLGNVLNAYKAAKVSVPDEVPIAMKWLATRTKSVYEKLATHGAAPPGAPSVNDWRTTGACYGKPKLRTRPKYIRVPHDGLTEDKLERSDSECGKYYSTYTKASLTGGLMVFWCRHSICVGFHTIPTAEGRNDAFAGLYCYWPEAPKIVVYDFACQLAPYAYVREADFFKQTRFIVDQFHFSGHTKCSRACSASFAMQHHPVMQVVNTSAAEVGNSGASRVRKSVSYMTQAHAIRYTKVYMDITNRIKHRDMEKQK
jgi:hypothetical protein